MPWLINSPGKNGKQTFRTTPAETIISNISDIYFVFFPSKVSSKTIEQCCWSWPCSTIRQLRLTPWAVQGDSLSICKCEHNWIENDQKSRFEWRKISPFTLTLCSPVPGWEMRFTCIDTSPTDPLDDWPGHTPKQQQANWKRGTVKIGMENGGVAERSESQGEE